MCVQGVETESELRELAIREVFTLAGGSRTPELLVPSLLPYPEEGSVQGIPL